ncbi:exopolysaccharide biosynthesis polyprenyl glycosylphosphotransferase [Granulicella sp. 5B5]|uniref:exopolysaccharide biosynthesis polyprenyl glycosylphosphotransferase n=1 Tax=Granulicella sp. 5B5 TaxID=1617967 RepID=UPI0015F7614C|nr:exopolysaccharide biosynthesis polyprenyl glycosylphosphotransferase [Granulicella sp. 5B5]
MAASESYVASHLADSAAPGSMRHRAFPGGLNRYVLAGAEVIADLLTCVASLIAAYLVQRKVGGNLGYPLQRVLAIGAVQGLFAVLLLSASGAYGGCSSLMRIRETERAVRAAIQAALLLSFVVSILALQLPPMAVLVNVFLMPVLLIFQKQVTHSLTQALHVRGYGCKRAVIYGAGEAGRRITSTLLHSPKLGLQPVAVWSDGSVPASDGLSVLGYRRESAIPVRFEPLAASTLRSLRCNLLIMAEPHLSAAQFEEMKSIANQAGILVAFVSESAAHAEMQQSVADIDGVLLTSPHEHSTSWSYAFFKRAVDVFAATILLIGLSPVLCIVALLVRLSSPGPSLFIQRRVGRDGEFFDMYKFRTMVSDAPRYAVSPVTSSDPRLTSIGRVLRHLSLDELPQLINVLSGTMSLVGPRPEMPFIVATYNDHQRLRLRVKPGITGLWQLSAARAFPIHENIEYDLYYQRHRTFFMDIAILIHTIFFAVGGGI